MIVSVVCSTFIITVGQLSITWGFIEYLKLMKQTGNDIMTLSVHSETTRKTILACLLPFSLLLCCVFLLSKVKWLCTATWMNAVITTLTNLKAEIAQRRQSSALCVSHSSSPERYLDENRKVCWKRRREQGVHIDCVSLSCYQSDACHSSQLTPASHLGVALYVCFGAQCGGEWHSVPDRDDYRLTGI